MYERPIPTEIKLGQKLALFREVRSEFYSSRERTEYLAQWLLSMTVEIASLRFDLSQELREMGEGQLKLMEVPREN